MPVPLKYRNPTPVALGQMLHGKGQPGCSIAMWVDSVRPDTVTGELTRVKMGGWLVGDDRTVPLTCGSRACLDCGRKREEWLYHADRLALKHAGVDEVWMITLTYIAPLLVAGQQVLHCPEAERRAGLSERGWIDEIAKDWKVFQAAWKRFWGEKLVYKRATELTKQGWPHLHVLVIPPRGGRRGQVGRATFEYWLKLVWLTTTGDSHHVYLSLAGDYHLGRFIGSTEAAIKYVAKYLAKPVDGRTAHYRYGLQYTRFMRHSTASKTFPKGMCVHDQSITSGNHFYNRFVLRKAYGKIASARRAVALAIEKGETARLRKWQGILEFRAAIYDFMRYRLTYPSMSYSTDRSCTWDVPDDAVPGMVVLLDGGELHSIAANSGDNTLIGTCTPFQRLALKN